VREEAKEAYKEAWRETVVELTVVAKL